MRFISYAQNYEDVILLRALRDVVNGFYVDVGAQHPRHDSVTKAFYDLGWHGINLEPVEHWHQLLVGQRPRDINLCLAAGAAEGSVDLFEVEDSGLSTTRAEIARRHRDDGLPIRLPRKVRVRRLDTICAEQGVSQIHFLKVDAEGAEADVLRGIDLRTIRPWVVLVEASEPNSRTRNHAGWESLLTECGYGFVYDDGLNRFYLADEHAKLASAFADPPNVFDGFVRREQVDEAERLLHLLDESDTLLKDRTAHIGELAARLGESDAKIVGLREVHHRDLEQIRAGDAVREQLQAQAAMHLQCISGLEAEAAMREQRISGLEVETTDQREQLLGLAGQLKLRDQISEGLSRELMAAHARQLASEWARLATHAARMAAEAETMHVRLLLEAERREYARVMASRSWRITAPLRAVAISARDVSGRVDSAARRLAQLRPARALAATLLSPFPGLARAAKRRLYGEPVVPLAAEELADTAPLPLTADAEQILVRSPTRSPGGSGH